MTGWLVYWNLVNEGKIQCRSPTDVSVRQTQRNKDSSVGDLPNNFLTAARFSGHVAVPSHDIIVGWFSIRLQGAASCSSRAS